MKQNPRKSSKYDFELDGVPSADLFCILEDGGQNIRLKVTFL